MTMFDVPFPEFGTPPKRSGGPKDRVPTTTTKTPPVPIGTGTQGYAPLEPGLEAAVRSGDSDGSIKDLKDRINGLLVAPPKSTTPDYLFADPSLR